jgi:tripeptide aminopeptidase
MRGYFRIILATAALGCFAVEVFAQDVGTGLLQNARVREALASVERDEQRTIADQIRLCEVPAPPFMEQARANVYANDFRALGLKNVRIDAEGNVLGERPGRAARPRLVLSAHLDTVFPEGTDVKVTRDGAVLRGPGIGDDCRGLAVLLAVIRALNTAAVETEGSIIFVGTVGEEGLGDLRGVKRLFGQTLKDQVDRFVSVDGGNYNITNTAVGSIRYRVTFTGEGGHSFNNFGIANPVHAVGRVIATISEVVVPTDPKTTFNVGRVGGGTSVNAIAEESWMEIDMRSGDPIALKSLTSKIDAAVDRALADENARWADKGRLSVQKVVVGDRPPGNTPADSVIVSRASSVTQALGLEFRLQESSTDANLPMSIGIPAIAVGTGGVGTNLHALDESFDTTEAWKGTQRAVLLAISLTEP